MKLPASVHCLSICALAAVAAHPWRVHIHVGIWVFAEHPANCTAPSFQHLRLSLPAEIQLHRGAGFTAPRTDAALHISLERNRSLLEPQTGMHKFDMNRDTNLIKYNCATKMQKSSQICKSTHTKPTHMHASNVPNWVHQDLRKATIFVIIGPGNPPPKKHLPIQRGLRVP